MKKATNKSNDVYLFHIYLILRFQEQRIRKLTVSNQKQSHGLEMEATRQMGELRLKLTTSNLKLIYMYNGILISINDILNLSS